MRRGCSDYVVLHGGIQAEQIEAEAKAFTTSLDAESGWAGVRGQSRVVLVDIPQHDGWTCGLRLVLCWHFILSAMNSPGSSWPPAVPSAALAGA